MGIVALGLVVEVVLLVAGAIGAALFLAVLAVRLPAGDAAFESGLRPGVKTDVWPAPLVRLERLVEWSASSARDAHTRLRPVLTEIAEVRLARRGLHLDRDGDEARRLLGPRAWELLRPERPPPPDRAAPGVPARDLEEILDALEGL